MKLAARDAAAYLARPDRDKAALLIFGPDAMRVALKRRQAVTALAGPDGEAELRVTRLDPADLRADPAALSDAMRASGFFAGRRVVIVDGAPDSLAATIGAALADWQAGDAHVVVTAGNLGKGSALRKLFEGHGNAVAAGVYPSAPSRAEIDATLVAAGLTNLPGAAMADLTALAGVLDPGDFAQTVEKLALYKLDDPGPVSADDIAAIAPLSVEADLDDLLNAVAEGRGDQLGPTLQRVWAQGTDPVALAIGAIRHFRALHAVAAHPGGVSRGMAALKPPVFGPRRDRMERQAARWGMARAEDALGILVDADLSLRSGGATVPPAALIERALFRVTFLIRR